MIRFLVDLAEGINEADIVEQVVQPGAFHRGDAGSFLVALPVFDIDFLVHGIEVTTDDVVTPPPAHGLEIFGETVHEHEFVLMALLIGGA